MRRGGRRAPAIDRILPANAVDELADLLSDCGTAGKPVAVAAK